MRRLFKVLTARYFWISQSIRMAVRARVEAWPGGKASSNFRVIRPRPAKMKIMKTKTRRRSDMKDRNGPSAERRTVPAWLTLKPWVHSVKPELETRIGHEPVNLFHEDPDHLGVGRQLGGQGLAAGVEHRAHEIEDDEGQDEDEDQSDGLRDFPADQEVEGGRDGESEEERQGEGDEDRPGELQEDAEEKEHEDADAGPEPLVLVHMSLPALIIAKTAGKKKRDSPAGGLTRDFALWYRQHVG